jgi:acyl carrier protein
LPGPSPTVDIVTGTPAGASPYVAEVLEVVQNMLVEVIGPEYTLSLTIELGTSFDTDLELESLEFVALAERLLDHYGGQVDFVAWLATMELDEIIALTVGDLVAFIVASPTGDDGHGEPGTTGAAGPVDALDAAGR